MQDASIPLVAASNLFTKTPGAVGARCHREVRICEGFFLNTGELSIVAACSAPGGTVEVPSNQVRMLLQHHSADCK